MLGNTFAASFDQQSRVRAPNLKHCQCIPAQTRCTVPFTAHSAVLHSAMLGLLSSTGGEHTHLAVFMIGPGPHHPLLSRLHRGAAQHSRVPWTLVGPALDCDDPVVAPVGSQSDARGELAVLQARKEVQQRWRRQHRGALHARCRDKHARGLHSALPKLHKLLLIAMAAKELLYSRDTPPHLAA